MRFYYNNGMGDEGYFSERNLVKAIYTAWNIEADLYLLNDGLKKISDFSLLYEESKLIFSPYEGNEFNSELLEEFGYKMVDGDEYREIIEVKTGKIIKYDWSEVRQLV
jgi:hypothetical protein